jgi:hypothetical protein
MARQNNMTWCKQTALKYSNEFGVNIVSVYNDRGLAKRSLTMNRFKFGVLKHKDVQTISRNYNFHKTRTYKQIRDRSIIENRIRQRLNKSRI